MLTNAPPLSAMTPAYSDAVGAAGKADRQLPGGMAE
jgi:hypothetical protein